MAYFWEELTPNGAYGDARRASAQIGEELTAAFLERAGKFMETFLGGIRRGNPRLASRRKLR
jgi:creatinine amidohydrolase/Fe(II)-dependent formamide hydrolase-like protein